MRHHRDGMGLELWATSDIDRFTHDDDMRFEIFLRDTHETTP